jgi:AraC-like DNA-binding protein
MKTVSFVLEAPQIAPAGRKRGCRQHSQTAPEGDELARILGEMATKDGIFPTEIPFLSLIRRSKPTPLSYGMLRPSICFVIQGKKRALLGREIITYGPGSYVLACVDFPIAGQVVEASPAAPYLGIRVDLDLEEIASVRLEARIPVSKSGFHQQGATVALSDAKLREAQLRFLRLLKEPSQDIAFLAPTLRREMIYRLLTSAESGPDFDAATRQRQADGLYEAIAWMKKNFRESARMERLAQIARLSTSAFHRQFKALTTLSPLQYRQRLRLLESRRLLLAGSSDTATAAFAVGYESATQFSREYRRLFGEPPRRDIDRLSSNSEASLGVA